MNDLIRLAMERAVKSFGDNGDGLFNAAGFSDAFTRLSEVRGAIDGRVVRAMLCGRQDVEPQWDGSHYKLTVPRG